MTSKKPQPSKKPNTKTRVVKPAKYKISLRRRKKIIRAKLPASRTLLLRALKNMRQHWAFFGGMTLIYGLLIFVFTRNFSFYSDIASKKDFLDVTIGPDNWFNSVLVFGDLLANTDVEATVSIYRSSFLFIVLLALIWGIRKSYSGGIVRVRVKDAFYQGMQPLIPVLIIVALLALQLLPASLGAGALGVALQSGVATEVWQNIALSSIFVALTLLSAYWAISTIFAVIVVTIPGTEPMQAIYAAKNLVKHRRLIIAAKLIWLVLVLLIFLGLIVVPLIALLPGAAEFIYFVLTICITPIAVGYLYELYRALI